MSKYAELVVMLKAIEREKGKLAKLTPRSEMSQRQLMRNQDTARDCGIEIRRLEHEAHCLAVEIGIADLRSDENYRSVRSPAGFGREFIIERRRPDLEAA